jgi:diamine N-acetyltransferase
MSDAAVSADSVVSLRPVTAQNVYAILDLKVSEGQERFVASNANSLAEAYVQPAVAWPRAIYADETPVGFLMLEDNPQEKSYFLWRLMIDGRYQGFGFGRRTMELLLEHVKTRPGAAALLTSCVPGEGGPEKFYRRLGFEPTGDFVGEEMVMKKTIDGGR